jgi:hypothetical protein
MARQKQLKFFLDNCVPDSVGRALAAAGHEVIYQRAALATDAPDLLVALASVENHAILMTFDKDHKAIASRLGVSHGRLKRLSRIDFNCAEPIAARRITDGLSFVEAEWRLCQKAADRRMFIRVTTTTFMTTR